MGFLVDVSNNNDYVEALTAIDQKGCVGAYAKATEALDFEDRFYPKYRTHAQMRGKPFGAYCFLHPTLSGQAQAHYLVAYAKPLPGDLEPVIDTETLSNGNWAQCTKTTLDALTELRTLGFDPIGYASSSFVQQLVAHEPALKKFRWWYADYASKLWAIPGVRGILWQWTDHYVVGRGKFDQDKLLVRDVNALRIPKAKKVTYPPKPKVKKRPVVKKKPKAPPKKPSNGGGATRVT